MSLERPVSRTTVIAALSYILTCNQSVNLKLCGAPAIALCSGVGLRATMTLHEYHHSFPGIQSKVELRALFVCDLHPNNKCYGVFSFFCPYTRSQGRRSSQYPFHGQASTLLHRFSHIPSPHKPEPGQFMLKQFIIQLRSCLSFLLALVLYLLIAYIFNPFHVDHVSRFTCPRELPIPSNGGWWCRRSIQ
jgi:hypothetical protein